MTGCESRVRLDRIDAIRSRMFNAATAFSGYRLIVEAVRHRRYVGALFWAAGIVARLIVLYFVINWLVWG